MTNHTLLCGGTPQKGTVTIQLLGDFSCYLTTQDAGKEIIQLPDQLQQQLLAILALHSPRGVNEAHLCNWLWERSVNYSKGSLHNLVSRLRTVLKQYHLSNNHNPIVREGNRYRLNPDFGFTTDLAELKKSSEHARTLLAQHGRTSKLVVIWQNIIERYADGLLPRFGEASWLLTEKLSLESRYAEACTELLDYYFHAKDYTAFTTLASRLFHTNALSERNFRQLMIAYYQQENRIAAVQAFRQCERYLQHFWGMSPSQNTQRLHQQIVRGEPIVNALQLA